MMVKNLAAREPSVLENYYKQYYLCLGAAAAVIKWFV
jgi:DNA mismatch repair protein MSH4